MSKNGRAKHIVRYSIILALTCYFGIIAVLNISFVQQRLSAFVSGELERILCTEVSIGNIDLGLLNRIVIQNVELKDRGGNDLLKVSRLSAKFELSSLLQGKIRISSVQLFGLNARLSRERPGSEPNFRFVIDAFASKDTVKHPFNLDLRINSVLVRRGQVSYDVLSEAVTPAKFNPQHIDVRNISATLSLKALTGDSLNAQVRRMSFTEQSGFQLKRLMLKLTANRHGLQVQNLELSLPQSTLLADTLSVSYDSIPVLSCPGNDVRYMASLQAAVTPQDLSMFVPALSGFADPVNLRCTVLGQGVRAECTDLFVSNPERTLLLKAEGTTDRWNDLRSMYLLGRISQLDADEEGICWLVENLTGKKEVPGILQRAGDIRFNGDVSGFLHRLTTHGTLSSAGGEIQANVTMHTDTLTHVHSYSGKVESRELDLGLLLGQEKTLGKTSFDVELKGLKYHDGQADTYIKGTVSSFFYKQYEYRNILLDGHYTPGGFDGKLALDDENGNIEINGRFATRQEVPDFNLRAVVKNFRPNELHLTDKYEGADFALNLTADFRGHSIDDMQGKISLDSVQVNAPDTARCFFLENLSIVAGNKEADGRKRIVVMSPFLHGEVEGNYSYRTLPASIMKTLQRYIPSLLAIHRELPETDNDFRFRFRLDHADMLGKVFDVPIELGMPATLDGYFDDSHTRLQLQGYLPEFTYKEAYYESGVLLCSSSPDELRCNLRANKRMKKGAMLNFSVNARAKDNRLETVVNWGNNTSSTFSGKVEAHASFKRSESAGRVATTIDLLPGNVVLNDTTWNVHPSQVFIDKDIIEIKDFLFEHANQYVRANGRIGKGEADSCLVDLSNINLQYVMDIIQFHAVKFGGLVTGRVHLQHVLENPVMFTRLDVKGFSLNEALLGRADVKGEWNKDKQRVMLAADIRENGEYGTMVDGFIAPKDKGLDLSIRARGTTLAFLQPYVDGIFSNLDGRVFGNVRLYGPFSSLDLEGDVSADAGLKVDILNTFYTAHADSVRIRSGYFGFNDVQVSDAEGHSARVNGSLHHTKLKNLQYDFRFNTRNTLVYHTEKETPEFPFYGTIYATGDVLLRGGNNTLTVDGSLLTEPRTSFTYVAAAAAEAVSSQFITFVDKTPRRIQEDIHTELYHYLNRNVEEEKDNIPGDMHINLQIEATPAATMRIILDPVGGDNISANGTGNLQMNYYNKGDFLMFGNYNIEEGIYKMSMQNVIRKDFTLQSGGVVSFNGNPRQANLDVQAVYTVNSASLNDLVADASNTRGTVKVNCLLNLTGELTSPRLKFDLELPTVSDEDRELVRSLTSTEEQMNTQIIYLLGIGKFYTYDYANNASQSDATSSLAFSTLSGQLNNMLSQVIGNRKWNFGTNLSTGEKGWSDVEAEAILSGRLLNNRLIINGNFGYRDNPMRNTNFVGDFEAMWLLTKNGEFRLKGYNQTNDRYFTKSTLTTQGIGLMYKKDFSNWKELLERFLLFRRNRRSREEKTEAVSGQGEMSLPAAQQKRNNQSAKP